MPKVFKAITRLIYYSNGGFSFSELYSEVPVYVRRFLIDEIESIKKEEKKAMEGDSSGGGGAPTASAEDTQKAMEEIRKQSDESTGDAEKDLEKVFGTEEEREKRTGSPGNPRQRRKDPPKNPQEKQEEESSDKAPEEDPAAAEDLEQMIDKLKQDI